MPSRILAALRKPKRIATSLPELRYLVFQGMKGDTGDSAYEEAVKLGFEGTEAEWLASLKGETGANGRDGQDGAPGTPGADGEDGVSPTVQTAAITGGHRVTITDKAHPQGQSFDVMNGGSGTAPAYLDRTAGVVRLVKGDAVYTSEMMQSDLDDGVPPLITAYGESGEEFFELDTRLVSASPTVGFRSKEHLLEVDSTGHFTLTDRAQGGGSTVYVTPEQFGAVGDGVTDDTAALREALKYCIDNKHVLFLANQYYITAALLTASDYSGEAVLNIEGQKPLSENVYAVSGYGGVKFEAGVNVFDGVSLSGSISRVTFAPTTRTQTGSIFHNCALYSLTFSECTVSNVLAFCHNTSLNRNSVVENSRFQTVYYFTKCDSGAQILCTDSTIRGNYINGGMEMTGNHCFEWGGFNGSSISDNFIDYYHTIFYPSFSGSGSFSGGVCAGNNFQVFRHFYIKPANVSGFLFQSLSDCFNWTDPATLQKLSDYDVLTYTGHDGQPHDIPPSILISYETGTISIRDAILQRNVGNVVFLKEGITNYEYPRAEMTVINAQGRNYANSVALADSIYGAGTYRKNMIDIPWVRDVQNLGDIGLAWSTVWYPGIRARKDNHVYRYHWVYNGSKWVATWIDETQVVPTMATQTDMSDWTSGKTVDAATMKTVVTAAGMKVAALEDDVSELERGKANTSDIPTAVSELTNDSGYQTAQDVQSAIAAIPDELPSGGSTGDFLRKTASGVAWETVPAAESASFGGGA